MNRIAITVTYLQKWVVAFDQLLGFWVQNTITIQLIFILTDLICLTFLVLLLAAVVCYYILLLT